MKPDDHLQDGLARVAAPAGFAERVTARLAFEETRHSQRRLVWPGTSVVRRVAAAVILAALLGGITVREVDGRRRAAQGERARHDVLTALHIASVKVRAAQREVRQVGSAD